MAFANRRKRSKRKKRSHLLKMCITVKKSHHEIKTILRDAVILLKINLQSEFQKAELLGEQVLIYFRRYSSKSLCQIRSFLGPMSNIVQVSFETKMVGEMLVEMRNHNKYTSLQQNITSCGNT